MALLCTLVNVADLHQLSELRTPDRGLQTNPSTALGTDSPSQLTSSSNGAIHAASCHPENNTLAHKIKPMSGILISLSASASTKEIQDKTQHAIGSILKDGLPDIPPVEDATESALKDWRVVFQSEMLRLRDEVNDFRKFCQKQIELNSLSLKHSWNNETYNSDCENNTKTRSHESSRITKQLQNMEAKKQLYQRKQQIPNLETELLVREKQLLEKKKNLKEYEKELVEIEDLLNHRQVICDKRQKALVNLDEELQSLRLELEEAREHIQSDGTIPESNSERARKNWKQCPPSPSSSFPNSEDHWDMIKRNLMDKQHLLENTVQKYRSELATATSVIAGKDILIRRLQNEAMEHEEDLDKRDRRIKQLESRLALTVCETRNLTDQIKSQPHLDFIEPVDNSSGENCNNLYAPLACTKQDHGPSYNGVSFRNVLYRRPSNNANSEQADEYKYGDRNETERFRNGNRIIRKRNNSISDNAISRLTLSTPRNDDKSFRGSSACVVQ